MDSLIIAGIYKLTNVINGKAYIGQSKDIAGRMKTHIKDSVRVNDVRGQFPMYVDMRKQGKENFKLEILETCQVEDLNEREEYYIRTHRTDESEIGYNQTRYAYPFRDPKIIAKSHTPEIMKAHGKRIREWNLKQWKNPEYRKKITESSRRHQVERLKDPAYHAEVSARMRRVTEEMKQPVEQYDKEGNFIAMFKGVREAERHMGLANDSIGKVCRGVKFRKTAGGYVWKYPQEKV